MIKSSGTNPRSEENACKDAAIQRPKDEDTQTPQIT